ncbi:16082_t:CDS:2 [Racocetra persica]|uniref:16082_t:CDS:1 n=1 Tax=Racocetra persica TaxID=160502 RepID=A0ACA9ML26_9GLOM|nr:16082_t:CDS:2 [Racocetra persica]
MSRKLSIGHSKQTTPFYLNPMKTNPEIAKITLRKKLREEVITLIASSTDYLTQIKQYLTELRKISQKEVKA